jgi:NADH dehydrogenase (ubiquinone) Fe-S protein 6
MLQTYDKDDYRNVRFSNAVKVVNKNWAIDLIAEQPIIKSEQRVVYCTGGDEHLGHPKVYINLDKPGAHACGYCGLRYERDHHHH